MAVAIPERAIARSLPGIVAVVGSILALVVSHQLWRAHLGVPLSYIGDALPHALAIDQVSGGWFWSDARLGAPFGQHFQDWPMPDLFMLYVAKIISITTLGWPVVMNLLYLVTYPLAALAAWLVFVRIGVRDWVATPLAVLYSVMAFHVHRGEQHLFLSGYFMVPFGVLLALRLLNNEALFARSSKRLPRGMGYASRRSAATVAVCIFLPMTGVYFAVFTLIMVFLAVAVRCVAGLTRRVVASGLVVMGLIVGMILLNTLPTVLYHLDYGANLAGSNRATSDVELYGLKLSQMLLPSVDHRISALGEITNEYLATFPIPSEGRSVPLGITASLGLVYLLGTALVGLLRKPPSKAHFVQLRHLSVLAVGLFFIGTVGGFSTLISLLLTSQIRGWNRLSIIFAFLGLAAVGLLFEVVRGWLPKGGRVATAVVAIVIGLGGFVDQTNGAWVPPYEQIDSSFLADQKYFADIETLMPTGAAIFELPKMDFPEVAPLNDLGPYDLLKPYLHTNDLRWSYGGVKGRFESEWQDRLDPNDTDAFVTQVIATGYTGIYVARDGYDDKGQSIESALVAATGVNPLVSPDQTKAFFDLRAFSAKEQQASAAALSDEAKELFFPVLIEGTVDYYDVETTPGNEPFQWANGAQGTAFVYDNQDGPTAVEISFTLRVATGQPARFTVTWPDGQSQTVESSGQDVDVERVLTTPDRRSELTIATDAERIDQAVDGRDLHFGVEDLVVEPAL